MDKRLIILGGVAAAAYFIMKKKASSGDSSVLQSTVGTTTAPESSNVFSSWLNGLNNLITKPAPAPSPTPSPTPALAPAYDNSATTPAPAPTPSPWTGNGGGATSSSIWDEAKQRLNFGGSDKWGGYIDYTTGIRHYNDGSTSKPLAAVDLQRWKEQALGTYQRNFLGI